MEEMRIFTMWFLNELPAFLMAEPVIYFVGAAFAMCVVGLLKSLINIK